MKSKEEIFAGLVVRLRELQDRKELAAPEHFLEGIQIGQELRAVGVSPEEVLALLGGDPFTAELLARTGQYLTQLSVAISVADPVKN